MGRKARVMLLAAKALLLSCRDNAAVLDEGSRAIVVEGGEAKQSHGTYLRLILRIPCK